jgi:uncharacterized protein (DUF58 family)
VQLNQSQQTESRRKHRLTRLGFHFLFVGAFAMLGGALRGFNLLLVLAGLLVGALIMQWRWSRRGVEAISARRRLPTEAFAGKSFRVRYRLRNHSRFMPVWMIRVEDEIESLDRKDKTVAVCGVGVISPLRTVIPHYDCVVARRGRYRFGPVVLMTTFPFSLFSSRQILDDQSEFHVFPKTLTLRGRWQQRLISRTGGVSTSRRRSGPTEGDFFGLREWQKGDSPKWIHWRTTARLSQPAVRQFEQQRRFDMCILVDAYAESTEYDDNVELAISLAATFLIHLIASPSNRVVLAVAGTKADAVIGGGSIEGKRRMLELLADVTPTSQPTVDEAVKKALHIVGATQDLIVISPRSLDAVKESDPSIATTISMWVRRGSFRWIDVSDSDIDCWIRRDTVALAKASRDDKQKVTTSELTEVV